uniref:Uncharacterized protein n=1 Tax=Theileria annulata TaxID=5874 RepID=A0A3B0NAN5_THEAN
MLNKLIGFRKEIIIGSLGIGTIYFGYKNLQNYFQYNQSNIKIIKNEILNENLEKIYNNINKKDLLLRNGDLIFIKYNLDKLKFFNKYKLLLLRNLCFNRIFDDVGIIYTNNTNIYILLIPSIKLHNITNIQHIITNKEDSTNREDSTNGGDSTNIRGDGLDREENTNIREDGLNREENKDITVDNKDTTSGKVDKNRGIIAIELDDLIRENRPDLISIRRLICTNSIRENLLKSINSTVIELKNSISPFLYLILTNWLHNFTNKDKFLNALTLYNDLNYSKQILIHNNKQLFNTLTRLHNSSITVLGQADSSSNSTEGTGTTATNSNKDIVGASTVTEGKGANFTATDCTSEKNLNEIAVVTNFGESNTNTKDIKGVGEEAHFRAATEESDAIGASTVMEDIIDELIEIDEKLKNYEIQLIKYNNIINNFILSNKKSNAGELNTNEPTVTESNTTEPTITESNTTEPNTIESNTKSNTKSFIKSNTVELNKSLKRIWKKKYLIGEMELINIIYKNSNLLPKNDINFSIYNFFGMDSLFNGTQESNIYLKLSSPFNIYNGSINKIRFQNLKYTQIQDILDYKL